LRLAPIVKDIFCFLFALTPYFIVPGTTFISPVGASGKQELCTAGKSHTDGKPVAAHAQQRYAKSRKTVAISSALSVSYRMHQDMTDGFVVRPSGAEYYSLLEFPSALSDRAPPLFDTMESFILS
jgi:hypothetical protein